MPSKLGQCKSCGLEKELATYQKNKGGRYYFRKHCVACWSDSRQPYQQKYRQKNAQRLTEYDAQKYAKNRAALNAASRRYYRKLQGVVFEKYGNECACCGESEQAFLSIDHVNNDGGQHRKKIGVGHILFRWIIDNNFPETLQLLCCNCNIGKHRNGGVCPHETNRMNYTKPSQRVTPSIDQ